MIWICHASTEQPSPPSRVSGHAPNQRTIDPESMINDRMLADIQINTKIILSRSMASYAIGSLCML